jgi:hypothetical protein
MEIEGSEFVYSKNICKETNQPYMIRIDYDDRHKVAEFEIIVNADSGTRCYPTVIGRKTISGNKTTNIALGRTLSGVGHVSPGKVIIHFENGDHLDLRKKNMKPMTLGNYRKLILEKKLGRSLSMDFSNK